MSTSTTDIHNYETKTSEEVIDSVQSIPPSFDALHKDIYDEYSHENKTKESLTSTYIGDSLLSNELKDLLASKMNVEKFLEYVWLNILGNHDLIPSPFGSKKITYADYTASGRGLEFLERYIYEEVLPLYANVHTTTDTTGLQTTLTRYDAREIIKRNCKASNTDDTVLFCGSGSTSCFQTVCDILQLRELVIYHSIRKTDIPVILIGPMEHHSNLLPWRETGAICFNIMSKHTQPTTYCISHVLDNCIHKARVDADVIPCFSCIYVNKLNAEKKQKDKSSATQQQEQQDEQEKVYVCPRCTKDIDYTRMITPTVTLYDYHDGVASQSHIALVLSIMEPTSNATNIHVDLTNLHSYDTTNSRTSTGSSLVTNYTPPLLLSCFSAGSNVTGELEDTIETTALIKSKHGLTLWDYAAVAPYIPIDMNPYNKDMYRKDFIIFSTHKFVGGISTPGILCVKKRHLVTRKPHRVGGGTVLFVSAKDHTYVSNFEERNEGGTPDIVGSIRAGLVFQLREALGEKYIYEHELVLTKIYKEVVQACPNLHVLSMPNNTSSTTTSTTHMDTYISKLNTSAEKICILDTSSTATTTSDIVAYQHTLQNRVIITRRASNTVHTLPIISFMVRDPTDPAMFLHHNFICAVLNDVFGIQARGGCACAGPYVEACSGITPDKIDQDFLQVIYEKQEVVRPGMVRLNLPYMSPMFEIEYILKCMAWVSIHAWKLLPCYTFVISSGEWKHKSKMTRMLGRRWLSNIMYTGQGLMYTTMREQLQYVIQEDTLVDVHITNHTDTNASTIQIYNMGSNSSSSNTSNTSNHEDGTKLTGIVSMHAKHHTLVCNGIARVLQKQFDDANAMVANITCTVHDNILYKYPEYVRYYTQTNADTGVLLEEYKQLVSSTNLTDIQVMNYVCQYITMVIQNSTSNKSINSSTMSTSTIQSTHPSSFFTTKSSSSNTTIDIRSQYPSSLPDQKSIITPRGQALLWFTMPSDVLPYLHSIATSSSSSSTSTSTNIDKSIVEQYIQTSKIMMSHAARVLVYSYSTNLHSTQLHVVPHVSYIANTHPSKITIEEVIIQTLIQAHEDTCSLEGSISSTSMSDDVILGNTTTTSSTSTSNSNSNSKKTVSSTTRTTSTITTTTVTNPPKLDPSNMLCRNCFHIHKVSEGSGVSRATECNACECVDFAPSLATDKKQMSKITKKLATSIGRAIKDFDMIKEGDKILVGVSGGKDSLTLVHLLKHLQRKAPISFQIGVCTVDPQTPEYDPSLLKKYFAALGIPYHYESQAIMQAAKNCLQSNSKLSICAFCSRMRRGVLYTTARKHGYNVLALGQHLDDLSESFIMSAFFNGLLRTMKVNYLNAKGDLRIIRPLCYVRENMTREYAKIMDLPIISENCPACFEAPKERQRIKLMLAAHENIHGNVYNSLLKAMKPLMMISSVSSTEAAIQEMMQTLTGSNTNSNGGGKNADDDEEGEIKFDEHGQIIMSTSTDSSSSSSSNSSTNTTTSRRNRTQQQQQQHQQQQEEEEEGDTLVL